MTSTMTTTNYSTINVSQLPWVPVRVDSRDSLLSPLETFLRAHEIDALAVDLAPVEREALLRFLESVSAMILRHAATDDPGILADVSDGRSEVRYPAASVEAFFEEHRDVFALDHPDQPFLQEWHVNQDADPQFSKHTRSLSALHVHVPGSSSSKWGLRHETRDASDPAVLALLLVVEWWHGKPSNGGWPKTYAGKCIAGAPSGGAWETSFHFIGRTLAQTLMANTLYSWVNVDDTPPAWLDQNYLPSPSQLRTDGPDGFDQLRSLWRSTWTPNRPLILWDGDRPTGYVTGQTSRTISGIGSSDPKGAAKAINGRDYCHAWKPVTRPTEPPKAVYAPETVLSTRGALAWLSDGSDKAVRLLRGDRLVNTDRIGFHTERGDTYGTRSSSSWVEVPLKLLLPEEQNRVKLLTLLGFADDLRKAMSPPLLRATDLRVGGRHSSALLAEAQRDFCAGADPIAVRAMGGGFGDVDVVDAARELARVAETVFDAHLRQFETPSTYYRVAEARVRFRRKIHGDLLARLLADIDPEESS